MAIKFEHTDVYGWEHAIRGMRNPLESHDKSDSVITEHELDDWPHDIVKTFDKVGKNDHSLMMRLSNSGRDHRKFMRMLVVYVDITAPLYWWKEFDTYKVGTVANSYSTMHCIHKHEFTLEDFSHDHLLDPIQDLRPIIDTLNMYREYYLCSRDKQLWWQMIQLLPSSYNQKRTIMLNYEVLANIYHSRKDHKLDEWRKFCAWIEELPNSEIIIGHYTDEPKEEEWF